MSGYKCNFSTLVLAFLLVVNFSDSNAQVRKYSNEFLSIGVGAKALGMSRTQTALADDLTSGYWNPAGLLEIESNFQVGFMHAEYFAGIAKYDYGAFAKPIDDKSAFALSVVRFGVDDIPNTIDLIDATGNINYNRISTFSAVDLAFLASYARKLKIAGLSLGANLKVVRRKVGGFASAWGFGVDVESGSGSEVVGIVLSFDIKSSSAGVWEDHGHVVLGCMLIDGGLGSCILI